MILKRKSIKRRMKIDRCRLIDEDRQAFRRICNPPLKNVLTYLGSADLQSAARSMPAARSMLFLLLGDYKSPVLIGRTFFNGGLQIRRDA